MKFKKCADCANNITIITGALNGKQSCAIRNDCKPNHGRPTGFVKKVF